MKGDGRDNKSGEKHKMIPDHQIGAVIRAYLKNKRDTLAKGLPTSKDTEVERRGSGLHDEVTAVENQGNRKSVEFISI